MDFYKDLFVMFLEKGLVAVAGAFVVASIVLFIVDGVKAGKEHRKRKMWIKIIFTISIIISVLFIIATVLLIAVFIWYMFNS